MRDDKYFKREKKKQLKKTETFKYHSTEVSTHYLTFLYLQFFKRKTN